MNAAEHLAGLEPDVYVPSMDDPGVDAGDERPLRPAETSSHDCGSPARRLALRALHRPPGRRLRRRPGRAAHAGASGGVDGPADRRPGAAPSAAPAPRGVRLRRAHRRRHGRHGRRRRRRSDAWSAPAALVAGPAGRRLRAQDVLLAARPRARRPRRPGGARRGHGGGARAAVGAGQPLARPRPAAHRLRDRGVAGREPHRQRRLAAARLRAVRAARRAGVPGREHDGRHARLPRRARVRGQGGGAQRRRGQLGPDPPHRLCCSWGSPG